MCRVLGVSTSGFYAWRSRRPSRRAVRDASLGERIEQIHADSRGTYGAPRVHVELVADGERVARKRVARLMRAQGLRGVCRRKGMTTTTRDPGATPARDLVNRDFSADAPDRLWTADITYVPTVVGFLYLAVVLDACSRRIVGWAMATHLRTELVTDALEMALSRRRPGPGLVHHSDQGTQYTSLAFGKRLRQAGLEQSMGSVADCFDNAITESFFATLETELLDRNRFQSISAARMALFDYIEGFYNTKRRHSALNYLSPAQYERRWHTYPNLSST